MTPLDLGKIEAAAPFYDDDAAMVVRALAAELRAGREELRAWRVVGEMAKRHECSADYQRTIWAAINAIEERMGA